MFSPGNELSNQELPCVRPCDHWPLASGGHISVHFISVGTISAGLKYLYRPSIYFANGRVRIVDVPLVRTSSICFVWRLITQKYAIGELRPYLFSSCTQRCVHSRSSVLTGLLYQGCTYAINDQSTQQPVKYIVT